MRWNSNTYMKCPLCNILNDSHNHLFFECEYSKEIWTRLKAKMGQTDLNDTLDNVIVQYENKPSNNTIGSVLRRILLATAVYHIQKERNSRLFIGEEVDWKTMLKLIIESVKLQLLSLKVKKSIQVQKVGQEWEVDMCIVQPEI